MTTGLPRQTAKCYDCEEDRPGEYVHHVWFCIDCLLRMARSDINQLKRDRDHYKDGHESDRRQVANLETLLGKAHKFGMALVIAVEGRAIPRHVNSKLSVALRELREFLCRR